MKKADKQITARRSPKRVAAKDKTSNVIVRDLMKPIYLFRQHAPAHEWVVDFKTARTKITTRENFYLLAGDQLYFVNTLAYRAFAIPRKHVVERIEQLLT